MSSVLKRTKFGNPVLRQKAKILDAGEIQSPYIQLLVTNMKHTLARKKYGVGLAAPQVGQSIALSVIAIKPTPTRPKLTPFETVIINPEIIETMGNRTGMWEGCISCGTGVDTLYAKALRYKKIKARWLDETSKKHEQVLDGIVAHVFQHEVDHLNGILFVDRVKDTKTYMSASEYKKRIAAPKLRQIYSPKT